MVLPCPQSKHNAELWIMLKKSLWHTSIELIEAMFRIKMRIYLTYNANYSIQQ